MVEKQLEEIGARPIMSKENMYVALYSTKTKAFSGFGEWGCCSSIRQHLSTSFSTVTSPSSRAFATHTILRLSESNIPKSYRSPEFLNKYLKFFNDISKEHFDMHFLGRGGIDSDFLPENLKDLDITSGGNYPANSYFFSFNNTTSNYNMAKLNLAQLSWIRFLQFSMYWLYIDNIMKLRENEDLGDLNNLEILQLAAYGYNHAGSSGNLKGLWGYKSPVIAENYSYYIEDNFNNILKHINNGNNLNSAFCKYPHAHSLADIKQLFSEGEYVSIYNKLVEPVFAHRTGNKRLEIFTIVDGVKGWYGVEPTIEEEMYKKSKPINLIKEVHD